MCGRFLTTEGGLEGEGREGIGGEGGGVSRDEEWEGQVKYGDEEGGEGMRRGGVCEVTGRGRGKRRGERSGRGERNGTEHIISWGGLAG